MLKYRIAIALFFVILGASLFLISQSQNTLELTTQKNNSTMQQLESVDRNYETTEEQDELPHFNLFSIINKFIPN